MTTPIALQQNYRGICRDYPRDQLPPEYLWECINFVPQILSAPLVKRGGWTWGSRTLGSTTSVKGLLYAPFASGVLNLAVTSDNHLWKFTTGSETDIGAAVSVVQNPVYHRSLTTALGGLAIIPAAGGATAPKSYNGTTLQNLAGSPPTGQYACVWNDYCILANTTTYPARLFFSQLGDPAVAWDTTYSIWDATEPIVGLVPLRTSVLMFHSNFTERLRGLSTATLAGGAPPTATNSGGSLAMDTAFAVGCLDARTIVRWNDYVIWADARGVYQSDGVGLKDITATGLIQTFWRQIADIPHDCVAAGVINDTYIISVTSGGSEIATFAYDLLHGFWYRVSNFPFLCFGRTITTNEETYAGLSLFGRVAALSSIFNPSSSNKNDGDGSAVLPYMETALYRGFTHLHRRWMPSMAIQSWRSLWLNYDLRDAAADAPTLTVGYIIDQDQAFGPTLPVLEATTIQTRARRDLRFQGHAVAFQVSQGNPSASTKFYSLEGWYEPFEPGRLSQ